MKSRFKILWLLCCIGLLILLAAGCNDTLRQFIIPVPPPTGDPGTLSHAITVSTNVADANGSDMHIDVSGDTSAGVVPVGVNPVFLGKSTNHVFVINAGDPNPVAPAPVIPPTVSVYVALLPQATTVNTVTLPATAINPVAGATNSAGDIYIANQGSNNVSHISNAVLAVLDTIPVGTQPVAIAGNSANNKIFVVNNGSNDVTEISTIDNTVLKTIPVGASPVWAVMSTDGLFVFVVNQGDGTVSVIDASLDIVLPCDLGPSCPSGNAIKVGLTASPSPNFAFYEPTLKRVYVSNTGEGTITVIKANGLDLGSVPQVLPAKLKDIPVSGNPTSVTALPDGTRAYAALGNCPAGVNHVTLLTQLASCNGNLVSVIDAVALAEKKTIPVGIGAVSIDASNDGSRVFVANAQDSVTDTTGTHVAGTISDISTNTDTEVMRKLAPQQDPRCVASTTVFCPVQTPFMVRTFP
ncbi:MAG TPA: YncE family protein [Candidatus Angelobacter sp.]